MKPRGPPLDLRLLTFADGERMLAINRACPIVADFTFFFDRGPDFFLWPNAVFETYAYVGGFREGELVAYALFALAKGQLPSGDLFSWSGDARVLPAFRGAGFLEAAVRAVVDETPDSGIGLFLVKQGNLPAIRAIAGLSVPGVEISRLCEFRAVNLLLVRAVAGPRRYQVRRAAPEDAGRIAELLQRAWRGRPFAPPVDAEELLRDAERLPGFGLDRYYLAFDGDELVGALGAWDSDPVHRITVLRYSWRAQLLRAAYACARLVFRSAAPLPAPGGSFRTLTVTRLGVPGGDPAVLHDLLAAVHRDHLGRGYHMIHVGFAGDDPLEDGTRGFLRQTFRSDLLVSTSAEKAEALRKGPLPYLDLRLI